jgi:3-oxoacyl-[acyl-carrier protein] reductase
MGWTLVTGGAKRLGAEICQTLAHQGHNIIVHYNTSRQEALHVVKNCQQYGVKADCIQGDFSTPERTLQFAQDFLTRFSSAENLINNAGMYFINSALNTPAETWAQLFQVNLHAPTTLIQALIPGIKEAKGNIINIGVSGNYGIRADTYFTAYRMTKMSLLMLTKSLARELAPSLVQVNMVSPGQLEDSIDKPDPSLLPMQRLGTSKEVARVVAFLLEKDQYLTGQNIEVAGGLGL